MFLIDKAWFVVTDILAGAVRHIAERELTGRGEPDLTVPARPFVDSTSVWDEPRLLVGTS